MSVIRQPVFGTAEGVAVRIPRSSSEADSTVSAGQLLLVPVCGPLAEGLGPVLTIGVFLLMLDATESTFTNRGSICLELDSAFGAHVVVKPSAGLAFTTVLRDGNANEVRWIVVESVVVVVMNFMPWRNGTVVILPNVSVQ